MAKYVVVDLAGYAHIVDVPARRKIERVAEEMFGPSQWVTYYKLAEQPKPVADKYCPECENWVAEACSQRCWAR